METNGGESETPIVTVTVSAKSDIIKKTQDGCNDTKSQVEIPEEGKTEVADVETTDIDHCQSLTGNAYVNPINVVLEQSSVDPQREISNIESLSRQASTPETHIPNDGSLLGATPTKVKVEQEPSSASHMLNDVILMEEKEIEECESSRSSPKIAELKSDQEDFSDEGEDPESVVFSNKVEKTGDDKSASKVQSNRIVMRFTKIKKTDPNSCNGNTIDEFRAEFVESHDKQNCRKESTPKSVGERRKSRRSGSECSVEDVVPLDKMRRMTRNPDSSSYSQENEKIEHPMSQTLCLRTE